MKKKLLHSILLGLLISGCSQEEILNNQPTYSNLPIVEAGFEQAESRTYIEDGKYLRWNKDDQISFFYKSTLNLQYQFDGNTGDNAGTFSPLNQVVGTGNDLSRNYAVYPYASTAKISEGGIITTTLPSVQSYAENSFGLGANTMVAATQSADDTFLKFKNVGGYLKLQLYGDDVTIKSITLTGNANEKLAGEAVITPAYDQAPTISMTNNATNSITLDCGEGIEIGTTAETATAFWVVVPPTTFVNGFTITIADTNNNEMTKSTSNEIVTTRNEIKPMTAFEVETAETIPNNQIWYTSSDGNVVNPYKTDEFGANITSNIYENGKGIITFDNDVKYIGDQAFEGCSTLKHIRIPNSIKRIEQKAFLGCTSLTNISLPNSVTEIEDFAFRDCSSLAWINFPDELIYIRNKVFTHTALTSIKLPNSVTELGDAFGYCTSLTTIHLSTSLTEITSQLFYGCTSLTTVNIPETVTKIGRCAFYECSSLKEITIPNSVTSIEESAFNATGLINFSFPSKITNITASSVYNCPSLESITIPKSVTTIEYSAFFHNKALKTVRIYATKPPTITNGNAIFNGNILSDCILEVPRGCGSTYYNSTGWNFYYITEIK